ncbi:MAG: hypothetical protein H7844_01435 [Nitrospirae bacterium YQR-1]
MGIFKRAKCPQCRGISGINLPDVDAPDNSGKISITCLYCGKTFEFELVTKPTKLDD